MQTQPIPTPGAPPPKSSRFGCRTILLIAGLASVLLIVVCAGWFGWWWGQATRELEAEFARIKEAGEPATPDDLNEFYRLPEGTNDTTALLIGATKHFSGPRFEQDAAPIPIVGNGAEIPLPGNPWPEMKQVEDFLSNYQAGLDALHEAAELGGAARFETDFHAGVKMLLPHAQSMRTCARMLQLEALIHAHHGDAEKTARSIDALYSLARCFEYEPVLVSQLVRIAIDGMALDTLKKTLPRLEFSDEDLAMLQESAGQDNFDDALKRALMGERAMMVMAVRDPISALDESEQPPVPSAFINRDADALFYLQTMGRVIETTEHPWPERKEKVQQIEAEMDKLAHGSMLTKARYTASLMVLPAMSACFEAAARRTATQRVSNTALAIQRFRLANHRVPASLDELVPRFLSQVPIDPYNNKPLSLVVADDHYAVFTVGGDQGTTSSMTQGKYGPDPLEIVVPLDSTE